MKICDTCGEFIAPESTVCPYCGMGCQLELNVKDNKVVKVSSVWDAPANHGSTCVMALTWPLCEGA